MIQDRISAVMSAFWRRAALRYLRQDSLTMHGRIQAIKRFSPLYPNSKLRGTVCDYVELGSNLVVARGRWMSAGLWAGGAGGYFNVDNGLSEQVGGVAGAHPGWVVRTMALGTGTTAEADSDTGLELPIINPATTVAWHDLDAATGIEYNAYPDTSVIFSRTFGPNEPDPVSHLVTEYALGTAAPVGYAVATVPDGPVGALAPYMVARKVAGGTTKSVDFTLGVLWTIEF